LPLFILLSSPSVPDHFSGLDGQFPRFYYCTSENPK
jgi:hypothetical protein